MKIQLVVVVLVASGCGVGVVQDAEVESLEGNQVATSTSALSSWVAPPVDTKNAKAFYLKVDSTWSSPAAVLAKPNVGGVWVTASNPTTIPTGPKMAFFGLGATCPQGSGGPTVAPTGTTLTNALKATGVPSANVSPSMRWTPSSSQATPACGNASLQGESTGFIDPVGGGWWQWTTSGPRTQGGLPFWQPFDSRGQSGSGANAYIQGSFSSVRQPWWLSTAPHPFSGSNRARFRSVQSVPSWRVGPSGGTVTQVKQQMTISLINTACAQMSPPPGPCQLQYLFNTAIKRSDTTDWNNVSWFQNGSLWFDPGQGGIPVFDGPMKPLHTEVYDGASGLPLYLSQADTSQFTAPFSKRVFDVAIEFSTEFTNALKLITAKKLNKAVGAVTTADLVAVWGSKWNDVEQWTLLQVELGQEAYNPLYTSTTVELAGAWHEFYVGPQATPMQATDLNDGFFCSGTNQDTLYTCGVDSAGRAQLLAEGWADVGGNCYHHGSNNTCTAATYSACTGKGLFCNTGANHLIEYLCTCSTAPTPNWVNQGNGCYQHDTKVACQ